MVVYTFVWLYVPCRRSAVYRQLWATVKFWSLEIKTKSFPSAKKRLRPHMHRSLSRLPLRRLQTSAVSMATPTRTLEYLVAKYCALHHRTLIHAPQHQQAKGKNNFWEVISLDLPAPRMQSHLVFPCAAAAKVLERQPQVAER